MFSRVLRALPLLAFSLAAVSCTESSGPDENPSSNVHNMPVLMGNFAINSGPVTTNQDGVSKNIIDDYVLPAQLPNVNFEVFTIYLFAPVSDDVSTTVDNVSVTVTRADGTKTGNIFLNGRFVQRATINGQLYSAYELNANYNSGIVLTKANFANVAYTMTLTYEDASGNKLVDRPVTLSVYQRK